MHVRAVPMLSCLAGCGAGELLHGTRPPVFPGHPGIKEQDLSMAGIRVETALGELPGYPEVTSLFVFSLLLVQSGIHVVFFFFFKWSRWTVLMCLSISFPVSLWSIRNMSGCCCLLFYCITGGGCWKHLGAALGDGLAVHQNSLAT